MQYVDVCIGNEEDAEKVLGFKPGETDVTSGDLELAGYEDIFKQMVENSTLSMSSALCGSATAPLTTRWSACIYSQRQWRVLSLQRIPGAPHC